MQTTLAWILETGKMLSCFQNQERLLLEYVLIPD